jgi:predicted GIY-YIG superfamily endonuclease
MKRYWVYIMANKSCRPYVRFTDDRAGRVMQYKEKLFPSSFTARPNSDASLRKTSPRDKLQAPA